MADIKPQDMGLLSLEQLQELGDGRMVCRATVRGGFHRHRHPHNPLESNALEVLRDAEVYTWVSGEMEVVMAPPCAPRLTNASQWTSVTLNQDNQSVVVPPGWWHQGNVIHGVAVFDITALPDHLPGMSKEPRIERGAPAHGWPVNYG